MKTVNRLLLAMMFLSLLCTTACTEQNYDEDATEIKGESFEKITLDTALTVSQARMVMQQKGSCMIVVKGYIVGCINGTSLSQYQYTEPFFKESNIVIADSPNEKDISLLMPVKLVNQSIARKELNLAEHPTLQYTMLYIYGKMDKYFNTAGITSIKSYKLGIKVMPEYIFYF